MTFDIKVPVFQKQIIDHQKYKSQTLDLSFKIEKKTRDEFLNYLNQNNLDESNPEERFKIGKNDIKINRGISWPFQSCYFQRKI